MAEAAAPQTTRSSIRLGSRFGAALARFGASADAVSGIEFAMLAPVFFALLLEVMQLGMYFYTSAAVDYATNKAARRILTGAVQNASETRAQFIAGEVCPQMPPSYFDPLNPTDCSGKVVVNLVDLAVANGPGGFYTMVNAAQTGLTKPLPVDPVNGVAVQYCPGFPGGINPNTQAASVEVLQIYYPMPVISFFWANFISTSVNGQGSNVFYVGASASFQNEPYIVAVANNGC